MTASLETESIPLLPTESLPRQWLEHHGNALYAYAIRRVRRPEVAEDLLQETLLAGLAGWNQFENRAAVRTWLIGILRNKIADHLRARYRLDLHETHSPVDDELFTRRGKWKVAVPKWTGDPQRLLLNREFHAVLNSCMSKLPTRMAHLFQCRVADGTETSELCQQLEITAENAWMLLHRARSRLRQCLTVNWFTTPPEKKPSRPCAEPST
jgi:RNA polymerase sigma-70 factor (ECF subfamily)